MACVIFAVTGICKCLSVGTVAGLFFSLIFINCNVVIYITLNKAFRLICWEQAKHIKFLNFVCCFNDLLRIPIHIFWKYCRFELVKFFFYNLKQICTLHFCFHRFIKNSKSGMIKGNTMGQKWKIANVKVQVLLIISILLIRVRAHMSRRQEATSFALPDEK